MNFRHTDFETGFPLSTYAHWENVIVIEIYLAEGQIRGTPMHILCILGKSKLFVLGGYGKTSKILLSLKMAFRRRINSGSLWQDVRLWMYHIMFLKSDKHLIGNFKSALLSFVHRSYPNCQPFRSLWSIRPRWFASCAYFWHFVKAGSYTSNQKHTGACV